MTKKRSRQIKPAPAELLMRQSVQLMIVTGLILLTYLHTLDVPFYLDDNLSLRGNAAIQDINFSALWSYAAARVVGYFTFAVNYAIHGYDLAGYHLVNIGIHLCASLIVYLIAAAILKTPRMSASVNANMHVWLPLLAAVLFAVHPLQSQAVTYIVQRLASLAALFYLLCMYGYLQARLCRVPVKRLAFFGLSALSFLLALFTKQNAVTLPLAILLLELCFLEPGKKLLIAGAVGVLAMFIAAYLLAPFFLGQNLFEFIAARTRETILVTRTEYLSVQVHVVWNYLLKFVLPINLVLNYEYAVPSGFADPATLLLALLHVAMLVLAILMLRRQPLLAFGILFYYAAHLVESSIIPIRDFGFDHRTYLPNTGLVLITAWLLTRYLMDKQSLRNAAMVITITVALLAGLTWQRNNTWREPVAFFSHEVAVNDTSFRAYCLLGEAHYSNGQIEQAIATYGEAQPFFAEMVNRGNNTEESCYSNYAATLQEGGYIVEAKQLIAALPVDTWSAPMQAKVSVTLGNIEALAGNFTVAETLFLRARALDPGNIDAVSNLAKLKILTNELQEALELFQLVNRMDPQDQDGIVGLEYLSGVLQQTP